MLYAVVALASVIVAGITFFSGFGLGTLLMPLFAVIFPVEVAVAATAVVHLANNIFKAAVIGKKADLAIVFRFGIPAAFAAIAGAWTLGRLSDMPAIISYSFIGKTASVEPVTLAIGVLMIVFAFFELTPALDRFSLPAHWIPIGGVLSGFFGGLSGHQGALRTIFLTHAGLAKEQLVGTIAIVATLVDFVRVGVYGATFYTRHISMITDAGLLVAVASLAAFAGSFIGSRLLKKVTMTTVRAIIGTLLFLLGTALATGLV